MNDPTIQRAQLLYQQQRYDMAADCCRQALAQMPQDAFAHALLGLCLAHLDKYDEATAEAQTSIHLAPDQGFGHYVLGQIYLVRNCFPEAQAAARQAVGLAPQDPDYWGLLANALFAGQRWREALDAANTGLQFDAQHNLCINIRAMAQVKLGDRQGAALSMTEALRRNPHSSLNHANQGWTMLHQNDPKQALEHFREALRLDPNNDWAKEGMMQALKARYFVYRQMLRYYLWMSRFTRRGQWGVIIGFWLGIQVLSAVKESYPNAAPFIYPVLVAYALFVLASWLADPIFNLTLLFNRFGRYMLTLTQKIGSALVGVTLLGALVLVPLGLWFDNSLLLAPGAVLAMLTLPLAATTRCRQRGPLIFMSLYTTGVAGCGVAWLLGALLNINEANNFFLAALWGSLLSSLASNIFAGMIHRK